jgi:hypothetical protein
LFRNRTPCHFPTSASLFQYKFYFFAFFFPCAGSSTAGSSISTFYALSFSTRKNRASNQQQSSAPVWHTGSISQRAAPGSELSAETSYYLCALSEPAEITQCPSEEGGRDTEGRERDGGAADWLKGCGRAREAGAAERTSYAT